MTRFTAVETSVYIAVCCYMIHTIATILRSRLPRIAAHHGVSSNLDEAGDVLFEDHSDGYQTIEDNCFWNLIPPHVENDSISRQPSLEKFFPELEGGELNQNIGNSVVRILYDNFLLFPHDVAMLEEVFPV